MSRILEKNQHVKKVREERRRMGKVKKREEKRMEKGREGGNLEMEENEKRKETGEKV